MAGDGAEPIVLHCRGCGSLFVVTDKNKKHCSTACRMIPLPQKAPVTAECAVCGAPFQKAASRKVKTCGAVCSAKFKRTRRAGYIQKVWKEIKDHKPQVTLKSYAGGGYIERDTPKRRVEKAKRAALQQAIDNMRYSAAPALSERERQKVIELMERRIGRYSRRATH